jgi:hypothetical protein
MKNFQADSLLRSQQPSDVNPNAEVQAVQQHHIENAPVDVVQVREATRRDPVLSRIVEFVKNGWPTDCPGPEFKPWWTRRDKLTAEADVLLWGVRVVVLHPLRALVLELLHESHIGSTRFKQLTRSYVWLPGLDAAIEETVHNCEACNVHRQVPNAPAHEQWEQTTQPWQRVHVDHAGPFLGNYWLLWIDAYSKFGGVHKVKREESATTVKVLRKIFALFGLQKQIVSDNSRVRDGGVTGVSAQ